MSRGEQHGHLLVERDGHVMVVTMNRPERKNALSLEMMQGMARAWDEANTDPDVRAVILTGAGGDFCSGAALAAMSAESPGDAFARAEGDSTAAGPAGGNGGNGDAPGGREPGAGGGHDRRAEAKSDPADGAGRDGRREPGDGAEADITVADIAAGVIKPLLKGFLLDKPLVAAVEGAAIAGGTEILQATDVRIAGESARFGVSEVRWGIYPLGGSAVRLRRQIPYTVAADLLLTGRHITAAEALRIGLIGEVVPDGSALDRARDVAAAIAANGPVAVQAVLRALRATEGVPEREAMRIDSEIGMAVFASDDAREGPRAFVEKRTPRFTGH
jgi:enoyl-CoA hydratase